MHTQGEKSVSTLLHHQHRVQQAAALPRPSHLVLQAVGHAVQAARESQAGRLTKRGHQPESANHTARDVSEPRKGEGGKGGEGGVLLEAAKRSNCLDNLRDVRDEEALLSRHNCQGCSGVSKLWREG